MATSSKAKVSLKLLIDNNAKRVLFAEAGKDFVDFLVNLLHLPAGTVARLLKEQTMVGALGNLYDSIENLSETYLQPNQTKQSVLNSDAPIGDVAQMLLLEDIRNTAAKRFYVCNNSGEDEEDFHFYVSNDSEALCPKCRAKMSRELGYVTRAVEFGAGEGGFVKGVVTYMVTDDLVVTPMSTISSITMLNKLNVKDVGALEERVVDLGMLEGLKLLKASLHSKTVLTSVFLGNATQGIN
ncbi:hypothetical protein Vadar_014548 [Vaccinium darrowii]|uniref:Uncharacterized protein n=1 Tax=Vaccinium darrowii TaxID=229202 RepID=A0ACB7XI71_9ERIC|nr:hypothetical protein Vadar_014548 [Vaccinium darrowii]